MKNILVLLIVFLIANSLYSQSSTNNFNFSVEFSNISNKINDGGAILNVSGGKEPYQYKWSEQNFSLQTKEVSSLTEGRIYFVTITDAINNSEILEVKIKPESTSEKINSFFIPIVNALAAVVMTDVFAELNLYDNVIYDDEGYIMTYPNGDSRTTKIPLVVVWLILGAIFFSVKMRFVNFWGISHAISLVRGKYGDPNDEGEASSFQALTTALSATVGLGNIAGVAVAITVGGAGATFWMIIAGLLGMASKFVESTLAVKYRIIDEKGEVSGGPMYYLQHAIKSSKFKWIGKIMAVLFAVLIIGGSFGGGCMFQANQAFHQFATVFPSFENSGFYFGVVMAILVGIVIIGGIKSITNVTDKIVPFMAILYVLTSLIIIVLNIDKLGDAFTLIFTGAFEPLAIKGGVVGVIIIGFQRAVFSNEAGVGSASIAHSIAKTKEPISEGLVSLLEPFIDTVLICTMTALVLIFTGFDSNPTGLEGVRLTSAAFASVFYWFPYILLVAIIFFAFSTMISWSYYGLKGFLFLFGNFTENKKALKYIYFVIFLTFTVVGSSSELGAVIAFTDIMILAMAFPNIIGLVLFSSEISRDLKEYFRKLKSGEIKKTS